MPAQASPSLSKLSLSRTLSPVDSLFAVGIALVVIGALAGFFLK